MRRGGVFCALLLGACGPADHPESSSARANASPSASSAQNQQAIGQATLLGDGTIVLDLYRPAPSQQRYPKGHPDYASIMAHVGPLEPNKPKPVMAWPDTIDDARVATTVKEYVASKKGWPSEVWKHTIEGTDKDGNIVVTVTHEDDLKAKHVGGGKSFQLRLSVKDYAVVQELAFQ